MAKADERKAVLEEFAAACTAVARERAGNQRLDWEHGKDGFVHFHCPLTGERAPHTWNGAPRASAWISGGAVKAHCSKCVGAKEDYPDAAAYEEARDAYTDRVKRAVRWEEDGVVKGAFTTEVIRSHYYYDRDRRWMIRRDKVRPSDGRRKNYNPWRWSAAPVIDGAPGKFSGYHEFREDWLKRQYPEIDEVYLALHWYNDAYLEQAPNARLVILEGEKDCDTFNALMKAAGREHELIATCLCHPSPKALASHQIALLRGRDVTIFGDLDEAGRQHAENWSRLVWDHAKSVKLVREQLNLAGTPEDKDLTDWVEARGSVCYPDIARAIAAELLDLMAATPPLTEPFGHSRAWRDGMTETKEGRPSSTSPFNAEKVWTQHLALKGRTRTNLHTGEVEVVGPPWTPELVEVGARNVALGCAKWLERTEKITMSPRVLEDVLRLEMISPVVNAVEQPEPWDQAPAIGRMLQDVPLDVHPDQALKLWEILFSDLEAKFAGELHAQRYVLGVATEKHVDLARALAGRHGAIHAGVVTEAHLLDFARRNVLVVQIEMRTVADDRRALRSMLNLMQPDVWNRALGRSLPTPLFVAVGPWPGDQRTLDKASDGCLPLMLKGDASLDAVAAGAPRALAEAAARKTELRALEPPTREQLLTVDEAQRLAAVNPMLWAIYHYVTKAVPLDRPSDPSLVRTCGLRSEPLRHVVREQFLDVMRPVLYPVWRGDDVATRAFNAACRSLKWPTRVDLTPATTLKLGFNLDFGGRTHWPVPGTLLDEDRLEALRRKLSTEDDPFFDPPPKGGGQTPDSPPDDSTCSTIVQPLDKPRETVASTVQPEACVRTRGDNIDITTPPARAPAGYQERKEAARTVHVGAGAIEAARAILSKPGACSIDFETFPTDPAWHGAQAAAAVPRGKKGKAKDDAILAARIGGRALQRRACTLQLHHADGTEAFIRLTDPARELPVMFEPITAAAPWDDPPMLVAHNAQFETEVLLKHGVAVDVECTLIAAKCLYLEAVGEDHPQPVGFGLAALIEREFGRTRDKTIRDRDWQLEESLDGEAVEYCLQDARDALELWRVYERRLRDEGLFDGYRVMQGALLPTAETNLNGLPLDVAAHDVLMRKLEREAADLGRELDQLCDRRVVNHGSTPQVSTWIMEEVLGTPLKPPDRPDIMTLTEFLMSKGGLKPDPGGELKARDLHKAKVGRKLLVRVRGRSLHGAAVIAQEAGYFDDADLDLSGYVTEDALLAALEQEARDMPVIPVSRMGEWSAYQDELADFEARTEHLDGANLFWAFNTRLKKRTNGTVQQWRRTETGHLAITKGSKLRKAEQLKDTFPRVSAYLVKHAQWNRATKLIDSFGPTLRRWVDEDGYVRGQARAFGAWTGRQSCADPNLQNQPREEEFRALWHAS